MYLSLDLVFFPVVIVSDQVSLKEKSSSETHQS